MDPITAVGFAASILTFVDYAHKVVTGTVDVFKSGRTSKNAHVTEVIIDLKDVAKDLTKVPPGRSEQQKALHQLSASCQELGKELTTLLERLSTRPGQSKWASVRVALRSMRKEGKVAEMESTLDKYRSQILLRLTQIISDQQLQLQVELCEFRTQARDQGSKTLDVLGSLRTDLLDAIETSLRDSRQQKQIVPTKLQSHDKSDSGTYSVSLNLDNQLARIGELREALDQILEKKDTPTPEMRILQQLWFDDMYVREDNIHDAEGNTFEWILENSQGDEGADADADTESNRASIREDIRTDDIYDGDETIRSDRAEHDDDRESEQIQDHAADNTSNQEDGSDNESETSSSSISQTRLYLKTEDLDLRAHTQSTFQEWLRQGNGVFHISGKAGSGKSTLMKLIVNDQRTYNLLQDWAAEKELVTAQFFFWRAGSDTQRSRQGLYRSLLFETLKQCPHLIQDVFPEAQMAFKKRSRENFIDQLFFRAEHIETAFRKLVCLSSSLGCRMCLFVDGLDEYGNDDVDSYEYELFAKNLITWTRNDDIKILASSRPNREFMDAFSEDFRIHLHTVNAHDIESFSRHMFESDNQFSFVKDHYEDLVRSIVHEAAGVFLWARLVTRSLIASIHRGDPVESLDRQLEVTPKDLTKLYEHFFNTIGKADQEKAFKMLLILAHSKKSGDLRFNALFFSWLEHLDDHNFPMTYDMKPYTNKEIQDRFEMIKRRIAGLTHGLLEMTAVRGFGESLFFGQSIQFFHRTARDFVLENPQVKKYHVDHPNLTDPDTYLRLDIAELWFSKPGSIQPNLGHYCMSLWSSYAEQRLKPGRLEAVAKARIYHNGDSRNPAFRARELICRGNPGPTSSYLPEPESQLHYILTSFRASDYLSRMALQINQHSKEQEDLSYILSAVTCKPGSSGSDLENTRHLLSLGFSPMQWVLVRYEEEEYKDLRSLTFRKSHVTVWSIFIANLIDECYSTQGPSYSVPVAERTWKILELFLEHGACGNTFCLLEKAWASSTPTHVISLRELVKQCSPSNVRSILRLIDKGTTTFSSRLKEKFRTVRSKRLKERFDPLRYQPFHTDMWQKADEVLETNDKSEDESNENDYRYSLHSIWTDNCETKTQGLTFRIY